MMRVIWVRVVWGNLNSGSDMGENKSITKS